MLLVKVCYKFHINATNMMKIYLSSLIVVLFLLANGVSAQTVTPEKIITPVAFDVFDLNSINPDTPGYIDREWKEKVVPNKEGFLEEFNVPSTWTGPDPVLQDYMTGSRTTATIDQNFNGMDNLNGYAPPDTHGDVGLTHYMQMVNCTFEIFTKEGVSTYGPYNNSLLWDGFTGPWSGSNDGDPIVLYDQYADRWIASQFALPNYPAGPFYELIAVSDDGNPNGTWYRYAYEFANMPDYPKFGVWPDGYYMTINQFKSRTGTFAGAAVCVFDRSAMLANTPASMIMFNLGTSYGSLLPADADGSTLPSGGSYMANLGTNSLRIWAANINWASPSSSTISLTQTLTTQSFSYSGITINQPGTSQTLDPLASRLMYRLQYRKFADYEVMLTNHTVNANGAGQAGVRWYELRKYPGTSWAIHQQGTYAPNDGRDRWMGSVAMNGAGDIAIGYSVSSSNTYPSVRFAGQTAGSPLGVLDVTETTIHAGAASQTGVNRWGDYSMMSVDPSDDATFWYTNEYSSGGWDWKTKIASFTFGDPPAGSAPVAGFTANPTTVVAGNSVQFTDLSTNTPTSWSWTFTGGNPATSTLKNPVVIYATPGSYQVSLTATNSYGSGSSTVPNYITVNAAPTDYCTSNSNSFATDFIDLVSINGASKTSVGSTYTFYNEPVLFTLTEGATTSIVLSPNTTNRRENWRVWIDYNGDKDFNDAGELVFQANNKKGNATGSFIVPAVVSADQTRMRVSMGYGAIPPMCGSFANGEVEDYTINIAPAANAPLMAQDTKLALELFPNPAIDLLNVKVTTPSSKINVKLYSVMGIILRDFDVASPITTVDLNGLSKGIYYIGVDDGIETALKKFIKE